jgi:tetratricopeptide (TPR) repeat protein
LAIISKAISLNKQNIEYLLFRSRLYTRLKEYENAIDDFISIKTLDSKNIDAHKGLAHIYFTMKNYDEASFGQINCLNFIQVVKRILLKG